MAYDERLAERVRGVMAAQANVVEKKMFGGLAFMLAGNMACGIVGSDLMVRVGPDGYTEAVAKPHTRPMDFTGRPSSGMVYVGPEGCATDESLRAWVDRGIAFAASLPPKVPNAVRKQRSQRP